MHRLTAAPGREPNRGKQECLCPLCDSLFLLDFPTAQTFPRGSRGGEKILRR